MGMCPAIRDHAISVSTLFESGGHKKILPDAPSSRSYQSLGRWLTANSIAFEIQVMPMQPGCQCFGGLRLTTAAVPGKSPLCRSMNKRLSF